tara:strand:- start:346 stop:735 length:390 start_codon:yes stop_codon:yes gene_type:complete
MITIITEMTDAVLFQNYWMPLICKYREFNFIFTKTKGLKYPAMLDWSNVKFAPTQSAEQVIKHAETKFVYLTKQNEIPTYELMVKLREPEDGLIPKIHNTNERSSSIMFLKENYNKTTNYVGDVGTYLV